MEHPEFLVVFNFSHETKKPPELLGDRVDYYHNTKLPKSTPQIL